MRVAVSASTGLVGKALCAALTARGETVLRLVRGKQDPAPDEIPWDPAHGKLPEGALEGVDVVVHLSGEPIASGRWTAIKKQRILQSREQSTRLLAEHIAGLDAPPKVFLCASAIGFYGNRGDEVLTEESAPGEGFLAKVCERWEAACAPAREAGIRVVNLRTAMVLSREGGALAKMAPPFRLGLGGRLGDGKAYMSWITLADLVRAALHCLDHDALQGPVNASAPNPVRNALFTQALASALHRPAILSIPAFALRAVLGEMADEMLLASTRVQPQRLTASGYKFNAPEIHQALAALLAR